MFRSALLLLSLLISSVFSLSCYSGYYVNLDNGTPLINNATNVACKGTSYCIKEKILITGETGHTIEATRYDCDYAQQCNQTYMTGFMDCSKPVDLYIGNICCCMKDRCNSDVALKSNGGLFTFLTISFASFFFVY